MLSKRSHRIAALLGTAFGSVHGTGAADERAAISSAWSRSTRGRRRACPEVQVVIAPSCDEKGRCGNITKTNENHGNAQCAGHGASNPSHAGRNSNQLATSKGNLQGALRVVEPGYHRTGTRRAASGRGMTPRRNNTPDAAKCSKKGVAT